MGTLNNERADKTLKLIQGETRKLSGRSSWQKKRPSGNLPPDVFLVWSFLRSSVTRQCLLKMDQKVSPPRMKLETNSHAKSDDRVFPLFRNVPRNRPGSLTRSLETKALAGWQSTLAEGEKAVSRVASKEKEAMLIIIGHGLMHRRDDSRVESNTYYTCNPPTPPI